MHLSGCLLRVLSTVWSESYRQEVESFWPWSLLSTQAWSTGCTVGELGLDWMLGWKKPLSFGQDSAPSSFWEGSHFLFSITAPAPLQHLFFLTRTSLGATKSPDGWARCLATGLAAVPLGCCFWDCPCSQAVRACSMPADLLTRSFSRVSVSSGPMSKCWEVASIFSKQEANGDPHYRTWLQQRQPKRLNNFLLSKGENLAHD